MGPRETLLKYLLHEYKKLERRRDAANKGFDPKKKLDERMKKYWDGRFRKINEEGELLQSWIAMVKFIKDEQCPT